MDFTICNNTNKIIAYSSGDTTGVRRCSCGSTVRHECNPSIQEHLAWGCDVTERVRSARNDARKVVNAALEKYRAELRAIRAEFDHHDSDGIWQGDCEEFMLNIPSLPNIEQLLSDAGL